MKLRLQSNSIRLRLKRSEVDQLIKTGRLEEAIVFGDEAGATFRYVLETSKEITAPHAELKPGSITVQVPAKMAQRWSSGDDVGIESEQSPDQKTKLQILIEKDFACLNGSDEQNLDTFPNPMEGVKC
jgi:hypothetical protein